MSALQISIRSDVKRLQASLDDLSRRQVPFATAQALTGLAKRVRDAEARNMAAVFDKPTPFTLNSIGVRGARKTSLTAVVFVKDIAAAYLAPFEEGGSHFLGSKRALLVPKNLPVNQYGNLPRGKLKALKGRKGVFVGTIAFKDGKTISGVWQRPIAGARKAASGGAGLKLLIRFEDPLPVRQHLGWGAKAAAVIKRWTAAEFAAAMRQAMKTAK